MMGRHGNESTGLKVARNLKVEQSYQLQAYRARTKNVLEASTIIKAKPIFFFTLN